MSDIEQNIKDTTWEHSQHNTFDKNCSECFKEKIQVDTEDEVEVFDGCETCGGTGEVNSMEAVYPGEGHMAPIGSSKCPSCSNLNYEEDYIADED